MRLTRRLLFSTAATLSLAAAAGGLAVAPAARADSSLPNLTGFQQMVVDSADGHVFISGTVSGSSAIMVTGLTGQYVTTLESGQGVQGLALDGGTLYAALRTPGQVAVINAATLSQASAYTLPSGDLPYALAVQSGKLWVSYDYQPAPPTGAIGDIDLSTGTFEPASTGFYPWYSAPALAADPANSGALLAVDKDESIARAATYNTSVTPVAILGGPGSLGSCSYEQQLGFVPGGAQFLAACGYPYGADEFSTTDLATPTREFPTGAYGAAVAIAPDGTVAAGNAQVNPAIHIFRPDGTAINALPVTGDLPGAALAWSADSSALFAVTGTSGSYSLSVYDSPQFVHAALTLSGPSASVSGAPVTLTGKLTVGAGAPPAGTAVSVTRANPGNSVTSLPSAQTDASGNITVTDTPPATGTYTYTASYAGDADTSPAKATATVTVSLSTATLTLTGPSSVVPVRSYSVTGTLAFGTGSPAAGTPITVSRKNPNGSTTVITGITAGTAGAFRINDKQSALGAYTYTASYAGNATTAKATASFRVTIARAAAPLTLTTTPATALYNATVRVSAHLGSTYSNRTVSLYYQLVGTGTRRLIETAKVNSSGYLSYSFKPATRNVIFTATFSGDTQFLARSVSVREGVAVRVAMSNGGSFTTNTYHGTTYRVYHHTALLTATVAVTPAKPGECVKLGIQELINGGWVNNVTTGCGILNRSSRVTGAINLTNADLGFRFRIHAAFYPGSRDVTNVGYYSGWFYFQVVR